MANFTGPGDPAFELVCLQIRRFIERLDRRAFSVNSLLSSWLSSIDQSGITAEKEDHTYNNTVFHCTYHRMHIKTIRRIFAS